MKLLHALQWIATSHPSPVKFFLVSPRPSALWTLFSVGQNSKLEIEKNTRPEELMEIVIEGVKETSFFKIRIFYKYHASTPAKCDGNILNKRLETPGLHGLNVEFHFKSPDDDTRAHTNLYFLNFDVVVHFKTN